MTPAANPQRYKHHRFPPEIISHAVWLYYRFTLSYRDVEESVVPAAWLDIRNLMENHPT